MSSRFKIIFGFAFLATCAAFGQSQQTNAPAATDYAAFSRFIAERNIFDPNRYPHSGRNNRRSTTPRAVPSFALVGTMNYEKGIFAFFDGNNSDYRKVLQPGGVIAGYTVEEVAPSGVTLLSADKKQVEMKIGTQMRKDGDAWELSGQSGGMLSQNTEMQTGTEETGLPASGSGVGDSSAEPNDILKKLMQQREQELK